MNVSSFNIFNILHTFFSNAHEYDTRGNDKFIYILCRIMKQFKLQPAHAKQSNSVNELKTNIKKYMRAIV